MKYDTETIINLVTRITHTEFVMPSIQREFVWTENQIEMLFDSLMRDYPIGTFLFWKIDNSQNNDYIFYRFLQKYHQKKCASLCAC